MKNESYLRYLLNDNRSLHQYFVQKKKVTLDDLMRFLLLKVREKQYSVPDHYYRLGTEFSFEGITKLSEVFTVGLPRLADKYLGLWDNRVFVLGKEFNNWQLLLADIPPLILIVLKIRQELGPDTEPMIDYANRYLRPNALHSAMPSPYLPEMKVMEKSIQGFCDLHIHLNGAIETDLAWFDFLRHPDDVYREIEKAYDNEKVKEQIEQMTDISNPVEFLKLFLIAGRIRNWLSFKSLTGKDYYNASTFENLLTILDHDTQTYPEHPLSPFLGVETSPLILEGMLYMKVLDYLALNRTDYVTAGLFHYYLLITGLANRLLVQQTDAFGFEQFQKYTSNNFREISEKTYGQRFHQLAGNELIGFRHTEGRFSPKETLERNLDLTRTILKGFDKLTLSQKENRLPVSSLSLVAHFIKKPDDGKGIIRFQKFRDDLKKKTEALIELKNVGSKESRLLVGVDAAASEFDTPPEVFAPSFRLLRKEGIRHFTFHAGEDFYHVLTGLRAIYEALIYFELRPGDRIGHATASGVDVSLWRSNIGEKMWIRIEDYLDDLVFAYSLITEYKDKALEPLLPFIALKCEEYATEIYSRSYGIHDLIRSWKHRYLNPSDYSDPLGKNKSFDERVKEIFDYRHSVKGRENGKKIISVDTYDIFGEEDLTRLQLLLLKAMHQRQIIIETLPTSNIIIGQHHDFKTYHLYNWYKWGREGHEIPAIIVGCDDAGIFATNIYNEYCHIYCLLVFDKGLTPQEAMGFIHHLVQNAESYRF